MQHVSKHTACVLESVSSSVTFTPQLGSTNSPLYSARELKTSQKRIFSQNGMGPSISKRTENTIGADGQARKPPLLCAVRLQHHRQRVLHVALERLEPGRADRAVDHALVG